MYIGTIKNKILSVILAVVLIVTILPLGTFSANAVTSGKTGDCTWTLNGTELTISGNGKMGDYSYSTRAPWDTTSTTKVTIGDGVTSIGDYAFYYKTELESITISDSVTSIGDYAFYYCKDLKSITIPDSVTSIGNNAFDGCTGLTSIIVDSGNNKYHAAGNCLIETASKTLISGCKNSIIPLDGSVTKLGDHAFDGCTGLTSITIPDSVTIIGNYAFYGCTGLTSITIPDSVTIIGNYAFYGCTGLTSITIPDSVTIIGNDAFYGCTGLTSIIVDSGNNKYHAAGNCLIETASKTLILGCKNSIIPLDGSVTSIGNRAFSRCTGLTSITIPDSVTIIGNDAFYGCTGLTSIIVDSGNNKYHAAGNCLIETASKTLILGCKNSIIPLDGSVTSIASRAFENCTGLTSITIGNSVTSIGDYAFWYCTGLTSITIGSGVTSIGDAAFYNCTGLTSIVIPDSVTSIDQYAFFNCTGLKNVYYYGTAEQKAKISIGEDNSPLTALTWKYLCKPEAPVLIGLTASSITVMPMENYVFSIDMENWQASGSFTELTPGKTYKVYSSKQTGTVPDGYDDFGFNYITVTTEKLKQNNIPSAPTLASKTLTSITLVAVEGCEYSIDGENWQASPFFTGLTASKEYTFYQRYAETATYKAGKTSDVATFKTDKYSQSKPSAPTLSSKSCTSVTLASLSGCEYSMDGVNWQSSPTFSGLAPNTDYTFYQRYAETGTHNPSPASDGLTVKTNNKESQSKPAAPTLASKTDTTVTLVAVTGCEYSKDGANWQISPIFTGLDPETNYFFFQRYAETDTHYASPMSASLQVKTDEESDTPAPDHVPGDITGDGKVNSADLTRLLRYLNDWNVEVNEAALDVTGDGKVNSADLTRLLRYLNDWPVEIH